MKCAKYVEETQLTLVFFFFLGLAAFSSGAFTGVAFAVGDLVVVAFAALAFFAAGAGASDLPAFLSADFSGADFVAGVPVEVLAFLAAGMTLSPDLRFLPLTSTDIVRV